MNAYGLRALATSLLQNVRLRFIYIALIIGLVDIIPGLLPSSTKFLILSIVLVVLLCASHHGYVTASLKILTGHKNDVNEIEDGFVFIRRFFQLFPTYLLALIASYLPFIIAAVAFFVLDRGGLSLLIRFVKNPQSSVIDKSVDLTTVLLMVWGVAFLCYILKIYIDLKLKMTGYFLEFKGYKGFKALKASWKMMKGKIGLIIRLYLSFALTYVVALFLSSMAYSFFNNDVGLIFSVIIMTLCEAYFIEPLLEMSIGIMFMQSLQVTIYQNENSGE
jgi:hypothetical protein